MLKVIAEFSNLLFSSAPSAYVCNSYTFCKLKLIRTIWHTVPSCYNPNYCRLMFLVSKSTKHGSVQQWLQKFLVYLAISFYLQVSLKLSQLRKVYFVSGSPLLYWCLKPRHNITDSVCITYSKRKAIDKKNVDVFTLLIFYKIFLIKKI